jgi:hypothetical protein
LCGQTNPAWKPTPGSLGHNDGADLDNPVVVPVTGNPGGVDSPDTGILLARWGGAVVPSKRAATALYLYDSDLDVEVEKKVCIYLFNIADIKTMKAIKSWEDLAKTILSYSEIGQLVLSFHSYDGGIIVGVKGKNLDEVGSLFAKKRGEPAPTKVREINFFGCNVASGPTRLAAFAKLFRAKKVSGYTWSVGTQALSVNFDKGTDEETVRKTLAGYLKFIIGTLPDAKSVAASCRSRKVKLQFVVAYGSKDGSAAAFPLKPGKEREFKPLSEAKRRVVSARTVDTLEQEYIDSPSPSFEHVTVTFP